MSFTLCTSGAAIAKAGANVNSAIVLSGGTLNNWSDEVEAIICDIARSDVVTNFSSLKTNGKQILQSLATAMIAQRIIAYEPGAVGQSESTLRLNVLENDIRRNIQLITDDKNKTYLDIT